MKTILFLSLALTSNFIFGQSPNVNVQLIGNIKGAGDSRIYIGKVGDYYMNALIVDSIDCINDSFSKITSIKKSDSLYCIKDAKGQYLYFLPDNNKIFINGSSDYLMKTAVSGSENNNLLTDYWKSFYSIYDQAIPFYGPLFEAQQKQDTVLIRSLEKQLEPLDSMRVSLQERGSSPYLVG